jgi:hypothetical protein
MIIVVIDEGLEVTDLDLLLPSFALNQGVELKHHTVIH